MVDQTEIEAIREAHAGWIVKGGPFGNSERWIGVLLQALDESREEARVLTAQAMGAERMAAEIAAKERRQDPTQAEIAHKEMVDEIGP